MAGAVLNPLNIRLDPAGVAFILDHAETKVLLTDSEFAPVVREALARLRAEAVVLANGIQATELCPELPIEPKKGHLLITDRYPGTVTHTLVELGYVTSAHNAQGPSVACNIQPRPTGQLFIGSSRQFGTRDPRQKQVPGHRGFAHIAREVDDGDLHGAGRITGLVIGCGAAQDSA